MATEYEWKFKATADDLAAIEGSLPSERQEISMETTYFDTPSGSLSARRYTLRKRLENNISVCTLKAPVGNARGEWETEWDDILTAIAPLTAQGAPKDLSILAQEGLIPICGAKFTRIAKVIAVEGGTVELALDQGKLFAGSREIPLCEVEVELKTGTQAVCDRFAQDLAKKFALQEESESKFSRALKLYKGE